MFDPSFSITDAPWPPIIHADAWMVLRFKPGRAAGPC